MISANEAYADTPIYAPVPFKPQPLRNAYDFINLGEHLWYLGNSIDQAPHSIGESISAFAQRLDKCGFAATRAAARSIEATTVGQLQSQMVAINSSLYTETAPREAAFIKLGEFLWYVSHPKTATTQALENGIKGFLEQLEKCNLESRKAAAPLERFRYVYFQLDNMVAGASLDELAAIMQPIRLRIQHETQDVKLED